MMHVVIIILKHDCFVSEESKSNPESGNQSTDYSRTICVNLVSSLASPSCPGKFVCVCFVVVVNVINFSFRSGEEHISQRITWVYPVSSQVGGFSHRKGETVLRNKEKTALRL